MKRTNPTRGHGLLELWLAEKRAAKADSLIPPGLRSGTVVDIGCGLPPLFLLGTRFARRVGLDLRIDHNMSMPGSIELLRHDFCSLDPLPLTDDCADAVTLLASIEHIPDDRVPHLVSEIQRILRPGGVLILTTPTPLSAPVLQAFALLGLVSRIEIDDHQRLLSRNALVSLLVRQGFRPATIRTGTFEWGMNRWLVTRT